MKSTFQIIVFLLICFSIVFAEVNSSGRNSYFWITMNGRACSSSSANTDLILKNGYRQVNLGSDQLSCTRTDNGTNWVYDITWTGNNFSGGTDSETLKFSLEVEAYEGATYVYSADANASSVSSLGSAAVPGFSGTAWVVGTDNGFDAGESMKLKIGDDISVNGVVLSGANWVTDKTFGLTTLIETNGGNTHQLILGEGSRLPSMVFSTPTTTHTFTGDSFSITGAGSAIDDRNFGIDQISIKLSVRNNSLTEEDLDAPYSDFEAGDTLNNVAYLPTTQAKIDSGMPEFSWDRIQRAMFIRHSSAGYTNAQIKRMAETYQLIVLEKANGAIAGIQKTARRLKTVNPDIKILYYWNSRIYFGHDNIDTTILDRWDDFIDPDYIIRDRLNTYNRENPDFLDWWTGVVFKAVGLESGMAHDGVTPLQPSYLDGAFIDKKGVPTYMLEPLYEGLPSNKIVINNNGGVDFRYRVPYVDGTYREGWHGGWEKDETSMAIALAQEHGRNQKIVVLRNPEQIATNAFESEQEVGEELSVYLLYASPYAYFYHAKSVDATNAEWQWLTDYYDQFHRPLGAPFGTATRDGYVYVRSFEHADVWANLDATTVDNIILWKNDIGSPAVAGGGYSKTDGSYVLQGSGSISGTEDSFFFMSDIHYGNGAVAAKINSVEGGSAKAGIMFRGRTEFDTKDEKIAAYANGEVLTADAQMVAVLRNSRGQLQMLSRAQKGGELELVTTVSGSYGPYVKIIRSGDLFVALASNDGASWLEMGRVTIAMGDAVEMGMAVTSGNESLATAGISGLARQEADVVIPDVEVIVSEEPVMIAYKVVSSNIVIGVAGDHFAILNQGKRDVSFSVYDITGGMKLSGTASSGETAVSMKHLNVGVYLIRVQDKVLKIIKSHR